jgi:hypothetical protein
MSRYPPESLVEKQAVTVAAHTEPQVWVRDVIVEPHPEDVLLLVDRQIVDVKVAQQGWHRVGLG